MCGRFLLSVDVEELLERYRATRGWTTHVKSDEIFPSHQVPIILGGKPPEVFSLKWGFVASYTKGLIINARGETVDSKQMFKKAFQQKRCIVPANAFFEWKREGKTGTKYKIYHEHQALFSMAGIYDDFIDKEGNPFKAFTIITTTPNSLISEIHDRMPVILPRESESLWLDPAMQNTDILKELIRPYDIEGCQLALKLA